GEAGNWLRAVAGERADRCAGPRAAREPRLEADGIEAERGVAARVDECDKTAVTKADVDQRCLVGVVEWERRAGDGCGGICRLEHHAAVRIVERETRFAK